jgi:hypothetical protein
MKKEEVKSKFYELLGADTLNQLMEDNWVGFDVEQVIVNEELVYTNTLQMDFFLRDNKGDKVVFGTISYNQDTKKWFSEYYAHEDSLLYDSFADLKKYLEEIEDEIVSDGEQAITFK